MIQKTKNFSNESQFLLTSLQSLFSIQKYTNIDMSCFRANIVIQTLNPFEEDDYTTIRIGSEVFQVFIFIFYKRIVGLVKDVKWFV